MRFYDAHNHLQDERFGGQQEALLATCAEAGVSAMVVNGASEADWPLVLALARRSPLVRPSFGLHPWYLCERTPHWQEGLEEMLQAGPGFVGEIGLDRWILEQPRRWRDALGLDASAEPPSLAEQEEIFLWQLHVAAERNLPASLHGLQAWGRLLDLLTANPRPDRGFLLHSYGGPVEMIPSFAALGGYFSFPGYFAQERKARQRAVFRHVPPGRLLVETDAPDQLLPAELEAHPLSDPVTGRRLNHPANLPAVYRFLAEFLGESEAAFAERMGANFRRLFGGRARPALAEGNRR